MGVYFIYPPKRKDKKTIQGVQAVAAIQTQLTVRERGKRKTSVTYLGFGISDFARPRDIAQAFAKHKQEHADYLENQTNMRLVRIAIVDIIIDS